MKIFGKDKEGNLRGIVNFDKLDPKKEMPQYIKITITQKDIDLSYIMKRDNPPSQSQPLAPKMHKLGLGTLTLSHQWGKYEDEIIEWIQAWDRGDKVKPREFIIETTHGNPLGVAILNPKYEDN